MSPITLKLCFILINSYHFGVNPWFLLIFHLDDRNDSLGVNLTFWVAVDFKSVTSNTFVSVFVLP